ncbi:MAG: cell division protein FtsZ [Chloroflexi bacterium]|nr:cell division protein FtsZ [Chloroflexota bacterium]
MPYDATSPNPMPEQVIGKAVIKIVGVGGGGVNSVRRVNVNEVPGIELIAINTDTVSLDTVKNMKTIHIGPQTTRGLGAGGKPEIGRRAAEETKETIRKELTGADLVFVVAGMGGGTGTGAAPLVAQLARECGALSVSIVTTPFGFEGSRRKTIAQMGLDPLKMASDTMIVVNNDRIMSSVKKNTTIMNSFAVADDVVKDAIMAVSRVINVAGDINVDFADIKTVVSGGGAGVMAVERAEGSQRVMKAAKLAIENPLMDATVHGAKGIIFCVNGPPDLSMAEISEAGTFLSSIADKEANIFFGMHIDEGRPKDDDHVEVVIIATHLPPPADEGKAERMSVTDRVKLATARYYSDEDLPSFLRLPGQQAPAPTNQNGPARPKYQKMDDIFR